MNIPNRLIMAALWLTYYLKPPLTEVERLKTHARAHNERQSFRLPSSRKISSEQLMIRTETGTYSCLRMKRRGHRPGRAVLFICGGGWVYDFCRHQIPLARQLLQHVDCEIYYPFYPPATKQPIREACSMIFECYRSMLESYSHERIAVLGLSAGGTAAMNLISWNNHFEENLPMPSLTVAVSPGHIPADPDERELLEAFRGCDPFVPVEMVEAFGCIIREGRGLEDWMFHSAHGDFRNAGDIRLYYGEHESLAYAAPIYEAFLDKAGATYRIHLEPGMPHCYGIVRINRASRQTYDEITELIAAL